MQTFITSTGNGIAYDAFWQTAKVLDWQRLGKQRVEAYQIIRTLTGESSGWSNHPAVLMWNGYTESLKAYHDIMIEEWILRGYRNTMKKYMGWDARIVMPHWINDDLVRSHRSNLIRKKSGHYHPFWPDVPDDLPYMWPVQR